VAYAFRAAFHPGEYAVNFKLLAPLTLGSFRFGGDKAVDSILDTDFPRCTQIQKPINPIAFGEKKKG